VNVLLSNYIEATKSDGSVEINEIEDDEDDDDEDEKEPDEKRQKTS
jgi:hypothetical protein